MAKRLENLEQAIESILFTYGEPLAAKKIANLTQSGANDVIKALAGLEQNLKLRGLRLINHKDEWQLVTPPENGPYIEQLVKSDIQEELTPASLEVLAITAYHGPVTKAQIESLRGVNSTYALRNLMLRGLIEKNQAGGVKKIHQYEISLTALRKLGLTKKEDLPQYSQIKAEVVKTENILN